MRAPNGARDDVLHRLTALLSLGPRESEMTHSVSGGGPR